MASIDVRAWTQESLSCGVSALRLRVLFGIVSLNLVRLSLLREIVAFKISDEVESGLPFLPYFRYEGSSR